MSHENEVSECKRSDNVVLYRKGNVMLNALHCLSPAMYVQDWHSLNSAFITFLPVHDGDNEIVSI